MKRHFFTTCGECGREAMNHSGICPSCEDSHGYRDSDRSRNGRDGEAGSVHESAGRQASPEGI